MSKWKLVPVEATDQMIDAALDAKIGGKVLSCAEIYCAMLDAAPVPVGDDCDDILDCYAAESQQFSDEIVSLRASVESARTKAIALESRRDAWRDSAILSQRSASELARQVDQQAAELARLRAENERLRGDNVHLRGHFERAWPDTQRYRWLRATNMEQQNILAHYAYTEMDAAIDAAMAQGDKA